MKDLKQRALRGGVARLCSLGAGTLLRLLSITILARLLDPKDFGLVGMVTAFTGVLALFRDFGLSAATVQRTTVTDEQISTLFWINVAVGAILALLVFAMAPVIAAFYHEPRLFGVTSVLALGFLFNSVGVQHGAMLQREMRFTALSVITTLASFVGTAVAIAGALAGYGYWSLVAMTVVTPLIITIGVWLATAWIPGRPRRHQGIGSLMRFGGTATANAVLIYIATNFEKILLGRFWGADAIGIYGRAYQLSNIPTDNLNSTAGEVAFAGLSRVQNEPTRLKGYFLKGYSLIVSLTLPITIAFALFAHDLVFTLLGPKWRDAVPILRLLAPTILVFGIVNPLAWLLYSIGKVGRLLKMSLVITPLLIGAYLVALPHGPKGVAFAYSLLMILWTVPTIVWAVHDTVISGWDMFTSVKWPLSSGIVAGGVALAVHLLCGDGMSTVLRFILEGTAMLAVYVVMILSITGQRAFYVDVLRALRGSSAVREQESLVSV